MSNYAAEKKAQYIQEIACWNWEQVIQSAKTNVVTMEGADEPCYCIYLGSVFALTPSGKIYAPFARSNLKSCGYCLGEGSVKNLTSNPEAHSILNAATTLIRHNAMDVFGFYTIGAWPEPLLESLKKLDQAVEDTADRKVCPSCGGCGSEEAFWDTLFSEALNEACELHGGWLDYYEDGLYFCMPLDPEDLDEDASEESSTENQGENHG